MLFGLLIPEVLSAVRIQVINCFPFQMGSEVRRVPFPFKLIPLEKDVQKKIAKDFLAHPNGLASCNHWGFKLSATVTAEEVEKMYNRPLDPSDIWVVTFPKCGGSWTQEMVWLLANELDYEGAKTVLTPVRYVPCFEPGFYRGINFKQKELLIFFRRKSNILL